MLKTLTLSLSFAAALGVCSVSKAGGLFHHDEVTASAQGPVVSAQCPAPSPQGECAPACAPKKCHLGEKLNGLSCNISDKLTHGYNNLCCKLKPKPKVYTYEWVLKKKRVWGHHNPCASPACETCAYPSAQSPSPQAGPASPQAGYSSPQVGYSTYGASQIASTGGVMPAPVVVGGDEAPPAPEVGSAASVVPAPPAPATASGLLFSTPAGN